MSGTAASEGVPPEAASTYSEALSWLERQHGVVLRAIVHQGPLRGRLIRASQEALYKIHYYGNPTNYDPPPRTVSESYDDLLECGALEEEQQRDRMYMSASSVSSKGPPSLSHLLP